MRNILGLVAFQLLLSAASAYLLSEMSFWGKIGISLFYNEYKIFKDPVQSGAVIFGIQLLVIFVLALTYWIFNKRLMNFFTLIVFLLAIAGFVYTYYDFSEEFSHRILKQKFHLGGYLIWIGILISCIYFWMRPSKKKKELEAQS